MLKSIYILESDSSRVQEDRSTIVQGNNNTRMQEYMKKEYKSTRVHYNSSTVLQEINSIRVRA